MDCCCSCCCCVTTQKSWFWWRWIALDCRRFNRSTARRRVLIFHRRIDISDFLQPVHIIFVPGTYRDTRKFQNIPEYSWLTAPRKLFARVCIARDVFYRARWIIFLSSWNISPLSGLPAQISFRHVLLLSFLHGSIFFFELRNFPTRAIPSKIAS